MRHAIGTVRGDAGVDVDHWDPEGAAGVQQFSCAFD
jgi:hypothetical protein